MLVWLKIAGCPTEKPRRLCERHFDKNLRELIPKYPFGDLDPETHTYKPVFNPIDPKCCVPGCIVTPSDNDLIFHRFPLEKEMFDAWIAKIGSKKLTLYDQKIVFRSFRVCSRHFTPSSYCEQRKDEHSESETVLKPTAVPSRHLGDGDSAGLVSDDTVGDEIELEFQEADDAAVDSPAEEDGRSDVIARCEPTEKRKSEVVVEPPGSKRVKVELDEAPRTPVREARSYDADSERCRTEPSDSVTLIDSTVTFTSKGIEVYGGESEGEDNVNRGIAKVDGDEDSSSSDTHADTLQPHWDIIIVATRMCSIDPVETKGLKKVSGKVKVALSILGDILSHSLMEIVNIFGLQFLRNIFSRILGTPFSVADSVVLDSENDEEQPEGLNDELMKFSTILMTFSRTLYTAISHVTFMPKPSRVRNRLVSSSGAPGMSRKGWILLMKKRDVIGPSFLISLAVVEVPLRKELSWTGKEVFGYVDLGHGRISDVTTEATAALVFYANSPTHDFLLPIGYCLINNLSPAIRANLINLYLLLIHAIDVRCNAVVCEDSVITHQTYRELGVVPQNGLPPKGYFPHPWLKTELVYCFVDVDDALRSVCNLLAETGVFLSEDSKDIRWADVETVHGLPQWDLTEFPVNMTRFQYLRSLQLKLKKDQRVFKKNSSLVLKAIKKHNNSKSGTGSSEFLAKMDVIDNLFSGCNVFCKDSPAVCRENVMISLGRIRNALMYIKGLKDLDGCSLLSGSRRNFQSLALNLVSLEGYLRRILIFERRQSKKAILRTTSLTLRDVRSAVRELSVDTVSAKEFRSAFKAVLKKGRRQNCSVKMADDEIRPLHVGLNVTESYKYEPLNAGCELAEEYLAKNVVCRWLDETACPDCCFLVSMETAAPSVGPNLSSDVRRLLRAAERCLRRAEEVPLDGESFPRFVCAVLREMADFPGFLGSNHLFDSVEYGRTSHFTIMVNNLLRIFLRYRIGFMSTTTKVIIRPDTRETSFLRSAVLV